MPVTLSAAAQAKWMDRVTSIDELQSLLLPYDETLMHEHHVSTLVNSTRNQGAEVPAPA